MAEKLTIRKTKGTVPPFDMTDELRGILSGETTDMNATRSQFRLEDIRDWWDGTEQQLDQALIRLVEENEIAIFPLGDVTKIRVE